jgi:hypothetical protein
MNSRALRHGARGLSLSTALVLVCGLVGVAQAKPDFSGTWTLDQSKSDVGAAAGAGPRGRLAEAIAAAKIVITQTPESLVIEQHVAQGGVQTLTYRLDGSESTNPGPRRGEIKSRSQWQGATLVTQSTQTLTTGAGQVTLETKETRSVDSDGAMVVARETTTPRGVRKQRLVFRKAV